jgi:hypothetical protein
MVVPPRVILSPRGGPVDVGVKARVGEVEGGEVGALLGDLDLRLRVRLLGHLLRPADVVVMPLAAQEDFGIGPLEAEMLDGGPDLRG